MEGNQVVLILAKLISELLNKISRMLERSAVEYLRHRQRKRELGLKKGKVIKADKIELAVAKNLKKTLEKKERNIEERVRVSNYKLDSYKLEMQSNLSELEKEIRILQNGLDTKDTVAKKMVQDQVNKAIKEKTDFEKEVNKNLLEMTTKNNKLENEFIRLKESIKICDRAIDGLASNRTKDMTESMRSDFESLVKEECISHSLNLSEKDKDKEIVTNENIEKDTEKDRNNKNKDINKDDEFMKEYMEKQRRKSLAKTINKDKDIER